MRRTDWLLLLLHSAPGGGLDPVRMQKGMFLLAMEGRLPAAQAYRFEPYAYGPMSRRLYRDVRRLREQQLIAAQPVPGASWERFAASPAGAALAAQLRERAAREQPAALAALDAIGARIAGLSFAELLEHVYDRHPQFALRSVFRRRA